MLYHVCGYDDYLYHFHLFDLDLDVVVIDINEFGYNKKSSKSKPYEVERLFNFFDDVSEVCEIMKVAFDYIKSNYYYSKRYLYGHSTGGNVVINYLNHLQISKKPIDFTKVILCSPLTRFYHPSPVVLLLLLVLCKILGHLTNYFDLNALVNGITKLSSKTNYNRALKSIHGTSGLNYVNNHYVNGVEQPKLNGWINAVEESIRSMKASGVKIDCNLIMVCAQQYGTAGYFDTDAFLNPADMVEDVKANFKNPVIRQYKCPHDCLLAPFDNGTAVNYKMILEFLFE